MPRRRRRASRSRHALWRWPVAAFRRSPFAPWLAGLGLMLLGVATPALADAVRSLDPSVRLGSPAPLTEAQRAFIKEVGSVARSQRWQVGLPPSLVTAMAINETGWGQSGLTRRARNYFGIKADSGDGSAGSVLEQTQEVIDGRTVTVWSRFRAYRSLDESVRDLGAFLHVNPRYDGVWARASNPRLTARAMAQAGYATDPTWADKLIRLIDSYALDDLDLLL